MSIQPKTKSIGRDYPLSPTPMPVPMATPVAGDKTTGRGIVNIPAPMAGRAIVNKGQI
jgi:hypothetical protein